MANSGHQPGQMVYLTHLVATSGHEPRQMVYLTQFMANSGHQPPGMVYLPPLVAASCHQPREMRFPAQNDGNTVSVAPVLVKLGPRKGVPGPERRQHCQCRPGSGGVEASQPPYRPRTTATLSVSPRFWWGWGLPAPLPAQNDGNTVSVAPVLVELGHPSPPPGPERRQHCQCHPDSGGVEASQPPYRPRTTATLSVSPQFWWSLGHRWSISPTSWPLPATNPGRWSISTSSWPLPATNPGRWSISPLSWPASSRPPAQPSTPRPAPTCAPPPRCAASGAPGTCRRSRAPARAALESGRRAARSRA